MDTSFGGNVLATPDGTPFPTQEMSTSEDENEERGSFQAAARVFSLVV